MPPKTWVLQSLPAVFRRWQILLPPPRPLLSSSCYSSGWLQHNIDAPFTSIILETNNAHTLHWSTTCNSVSNSMIATQCLRRCMATCAPCIASLHDLVSFAVLRSLGRKWTKGLFYYILKMLIIMFFHLPHIFFFPTFLFALYRKETMFIGGEAGGESNVSSRRWKTVRRMQLPQH